MIDSSSSVAPSRLPVGDERIVGLDGLRAVSILLVLSGHGWSKLPFSTEFVAAYPYLGNSALGVRTFFVISGFLITYLLRKEWERTGSIWLKGFYARRVLRIFPAMYSYLLTLVVLRLLGLIATTWGDLLVAATFSTNYKHLFGVPTNDDYWYVGQFWTLSLEEQFYLLWPAAIIAFGLRRADRIAAVIVVASPLVRVVTYFTWPAARPQISLMLHTAADPIMIGCLAALWSRRPRFEAALTRTAAWYWPTSAALFVVLVSPWIRQRWRGTYDLTIGLTLESLAVAFIMLWIVRRPEASVVRLLSTRPMIRIGVLSYSLYMWQQLFLATHEPWSSYFPLEWIACFVAAEISYRLIEQPALRLRRWYRAPGSVAT